jgi:hypothetical protein
MDNFDLKKYLAEGRLTQEVEFKTNERVAYKDKNNPNFLYVDVKYNHGLGGFLKALGSNTLSGGEREQSVNRAKLIAHDTAQELEKNYNIEDIDVQDLENGIVRVFAVSDDFIDIDPKTDEKLQSIVNYFKHTK